MKNNTKNIARKTITAILFAGVIMMATLTVSPALASADPITVDPNSSIESKTFNYVHWGHWETDNTSIAAPGSNTTYAAHTHRDTGIELDNSTTTYTATTATTPCEYQLALFDMTMDNWLIWGGISQSYAELLFTVTSDTDYNISGNYTTDADQEEDFDVYLKDLGNDTFVFQHENTTGALSGSNLTGTIPPGDYEFYVKAESKAEGPWTWPDYPSKYGPISGGAEHGTGSVHLGLTAQVDVTPPVITCPADVTIEQETAAGTVVPLAATATDICDVNPTVTSDELAIYPLGKTTVTFTATDDSGNSASCSMTVTVEDTTPPVITCPADVTVEQAAAAGTGVPLTATATDICDADVSITSDAPVVFPLGDTTVTFTATDDSGNTASCTTTVTVQDTTAPVISCPDDVTVEQETRDGTVVPLTATATDICDADVVITSDELAIYPLGKTTVTFTATDDSGNSASCTTTVTVIDTTAPDISVTVSPDMLWPPNHKMVDITATVTVSDICDAAPSVVLTGVTSDEPDDAKGSGDGKTVNDIQGADTGAEDYEFQLRAERAGKGDGRVYTITYTVTDASGNSASTSATVVVPHDME